MKQPTDVLTALFSVPDMDIATERFLSLLDSRARDKMKKLYVEHLGKIPDVLPRSQPYWFQEGVQTMFTHWVELMQDGRCYRIMVGKHIGGAEQWPPITKTLVNEDGRWLQSFDLDGTPILFTIGIATLEELEARCRGSTAAGLVRRPQGMSEQVVSRPHSSDEPGTERPNDDVSFREYLSQAVAAEKNGDKVLVSRLADKLSVAAAQPILLEAMNSTPIDRETLTVVVRCLAACGAESSIQPILLLAETTTDADTLRSIAAGIDHLVNPEAIPVLVRAISVGLDKQLEGACSRALARMPSDEATKVLLKAYRISDQDSRELVAKAVKGIQCPASVGVLAEAAKKWDDDVLGLAVVAGLGSVATDEALSVLIDLVALNSINENPARLAAVETALKAILARREHDEKMVKIIAGALGSPLTTVRALAARVLGESRGSHAALDALIEASGSETDAGVSDAIQKARTKLQSPPPGSGRREKADDPK